MRVIGALVGCILHTFYSFVMLLEPVLAIVFVVINICALASVCTLYTPLLVNVVLSLQGSIFMHYMPHLTDASSTFLSFFARRSMQEQQCGAKKCTALAAFRQKAPGWGGGGGQQLGGPCFFVLQEGGQRHWGGG